MRIKIPYGRRSVALTLDSKRLLGVITTGHLPGRDLKELFRESLDDGPAGRKLAAILRGKKKVLMAVPDATRSAHLKEILPELIARVSGSSRTIDIVVATGLHKGHSPRQLEALLGRTISRSYKVINHDYSSANLIKTGTTRFGIPVVLNSILTGYDLIISVGVIEPHLYAGYSGGFKTVAIGLAGEETINATHSVRFLDHPGTRIGKIRGNPFQETLREIAGAVGIGFSVNVVNDSDGAAMKIFSGATEKVFRRGVAFAKAMFEVRVKKAADIVICGVGYPKDVNLYQASRAINYILNVDRPVLKEGGVLIVVAGLEDGVGEGLSEKRFYDELKRMGSPAAFIDRVKGDGCIAGVHRAYMVARPMLKHKMVFVSLKKKGFMEGLEFPFFDKIADALNYAENITGKDSKIYVVPKALCVIVGLR